MEVKTGQRGAHLSSKKVKRQTCDDEGPGKFSVHDFLKYRLRLCTGNILQLKFISKVFDQTPQTLWERSLWPSVTFRRKTKVGTLRCKKLISSRGWTELLQTSGGLEMRRAEERWCLALNVWGQRSVQLQQSPETMAHKDVHIVCVQILLFTYRESEIKKLQWNLNKPWSLKQTLWILKDFDAFIEDRLCFKFIRTILHDVHETCNMLWILMAQWAVCDEWWSASECRLSLADSWGQFHYGYSLYFENLQNLAGNQQPQSCVFKHSLFSAALELKNRADWRRERAADVILASKEN